MITLKLLSELNILLGEIEEWNFSIEGYDLDKPQYLYYTKDQNVIRGNLTWGVNKILTITQGISTIDLVNREFTSNLHGLYNNNRVKFQSSGSIPSGISTNQFYYVVEATSNTFKVSATLGGEAIVINNRGTGILSVFCNKYSYTDTLVNVFNNRFDVPNSLLVDNDIISFDTDPGSFVAWPIEIGKNYYVVNATGSNFKISETEGGSPFTLINSGGTSQYYLTDYGAENNLKRIVYETSSDGGLTYSPVGTLEYNYSNVGKLLGANWL